MNAVREKHSPEFMVKQFIQATADILTTMCGVHELEKLGRFLRDDSEPPLGDFSAIMDLTGDSKGSMVLSFPEKTIRCLAAKMLEVQTDELSVANIHDATGEVINMVAGRAKKLLTDTKFSFSISIPTVVSGNDHTITWQNDKPYIGVKLRADQDEFIMYLSVVPQEQVVKTSKKRRVK